MANTSIEWATKVWNPLRGCNKVSEGCRNCYAIRQAHRFSGSGRPFEGLTEKTAAGVNWTGVVKLVPEMLELPLKWKKPQRIFVNSMSDLFHVEVTDEFISNVFAIMSLAPRHTFQILTKRPARMRSLLSSAMFWIQVNAHRFARGVSVLSGAGPVLLPNVWLGVSVENQKAADERIPLLLKTPATVRFLSSEPLIGLVDLNHVQVDSGTAVDSLRGIRHVVEYKEHQFQHQKIDWVIVGGESGPGARPMHPDWARSIRDQCQAASVPFFFKQWGSWMPYVDDEKFVHGDEETARNMQHYLNPDGTSGACWLVDGDGTWQNWTGDPQEDCAIVNRVGKKNAGRLLDGREWNEYPETSR